MLRALMLRKKITEAQKTLEELRAKKSELETRSEELKKREEELAQSIEEASTEEEQKAVEEAADTYEADKAALDTETSENDQKIADLEGEIAEMENELSEIENQQRAKKAPASDDSKKQPVGANITERNSHTMFKVRSLNKMTDAERLAFTQREDVQKTLSEIRTLIKEKRTVSGSEVFIGLSIFDLIRDNVLEYSKLYARVRAYFTTQKGRQPVEGAIPEAIWTECCAAINELDIDFSGVELDCYKVAGYFAVCNARIEDSDIDLIDIFSDALMQAIGLALDKAYIYGTGTKMPTGVMTALADPETGIPANLITVPSSATGVALFQAILLGGAQADGAKSRGSKLWIVNEKTRMKLVTEALGFNASGAIVSGVNETMPVDGGDLIVLPFIPDNNIVVGYFDLYVSLIKKEMTVSQSTECRFIEDQTVIKGVMRADGKPAVTGAFAGIGLGEAPTTEVEFPGSPSQG